MSDKTELYATHPKTGKRHRWEVGDKRGASAGEFILVSVYGSCAIIGQWRLTSVSEGEFFILRDLGPVEGGAPAEVSRLKARVEELDKAVLRENRRAIDAEARVDEQKQAAVNYVSRINELEQALESKEAAPLPVGVVRLPIAESNDDDDNFTEFGTFRLDVLEYPQAGDVVLVPAYMRGASFQAVTVPRALPTGDRDNLRIILRRLDAPEEKTPERPAFIGSMPDLPDGFPRDDDPEEKQPEKPKSDNLSPVWSCGKYTIGLDTGSSEGSQSVALVVDVETGRVIQQFRGAGLDFDNALHTIIAKYRALAEKSTETPAPCPYCEGKGTDPLDGRWDCRECEGEGYLKPAPSQPVPNAGPITTEAWILRTANEEKPAPPKDALGTACPRCHGTGWDVPPGTVTPGKEQSPGYKCPDCLGSGIAAPPKGEPKRTALVIFRDGQAVWSSDGYPLGPSMTLHHC